MRIMMITGGDVARAPDRESTCSPHRHPGLDPGSRFFSSPHGKAGLRIKSGVTKGRMAAAKMTGILAFLALAAPAVQAVPSSPANPVQLRIGYKAAATNVCAAPDAKTPPGMAALAKHLAGRLQTSVQLCPFADANDAAAAIAAGKVDFANLTAAAWPAAKGKGRPILTVRPDGKLPRTLIYAIAKKSAGKLDPAAIAQRRVIAIRQDVVSYDAARAAITTRGGGALTANPTPLAGSFAAAIGALAAGKADVALVPANEWKAGCLADKTICPPYQIAWQGRPVADNAWVLRAGLPDELHYRLIGIFLALHLENAQAYAAAADGVKGAFEPAETAALDGEPGK